MTPVTLNTSWGREAPSWLGVTECPAPWAPSSRCCWCREGRSQTQTMQACPAQLCSTGRQESPWVQGEEMEVGCRCLQMEKQVTPLSSVFPFTSSYHHIHLSIYLPSEGQTGLPEPFCSRDGPKYTGCWKLPVHQSHFLLPCPPCPYQDCPQPRDNSQHR